MFSIFMIFLFLILPLLLCHVIIAKKFQRGQNLPPGPYQWPLIGNIPNLLGKNPHITVANLSRIHGPLISLKLGTQLLIMGSSPQAAAEILKTNDRHLSARYTAKATPISAADLRKFSILWAPECNSNWKTLRAVWRSQLFGEKAMGFQASVREKKVSEMVEFLIGKEGEMVNIGDLVFTTVFNTVANHCFSRDLIGLGDDQKLVRDWKETIWEFMESGTTPTIADFYPMFGGLDPMGQKNKTLKYLRKLFGRWEEIIRQRKEIIGGALLDSCLHYNEGGDFLDFMVASGFLDDQMLHMLLEIFPAACGNITTTVEWAMAELIKNKSAMTKLLEELQSDRITKKIIANNNSNDSLKESHISQLPYLNACVKETLRMHPPIAFVPHLASATCQVMTYTVPKGSLIMMNLWALGHDPNTWKDPFSFQPERFMDSGMDFEGCDFEYLPFGAGRRMCPGIQFATKQVHLILASLVHFFDWNLPKCNNGSTDVEIDMNEKYGVPLQKEKPLILVPKKKF